MNSVKAEFFPPRKKGRCSLNGTADTDGWIVAIGDGTARRRFLSYAGFKRIINMMLDDLELEPETTNCTTVNDGEAARHA